MSNEDHLGGPTFLSPLFPFPLIDHLLTLLESEVLEVRWCGRFMLEISLLKLAWRFAVWKRRMKSDNSLSDRRTTKHDSKDTNQK